MNLFIILLLLAIAIDLIDMIPVPVDIILTLALRIVFFLGIMKRYGLKGKKQKEAIMQIIKRLFVQAVDILCSLIPIVEFFSFFNTISIIVMERKKRKEDRQAQEAKDKKSAGKAKSRTQIVKKFKPGAGSSAGSGLKPVPVNSKT